LIWNLLPLKDPSFVFIHIGYGVFLHEIIRLLFFVLYVRVDKGFEKTTSNKIYTSKYGNIPVGIASGVGFAISKALISNGSMLPLSLDLGSFYPDSCPILSFFFVSCNLFLSKSCSNDQFLCSSE
jgi:hypothetical protein